ncbi:MAG TPA: hypothetical protein PKM27_04585 [Saprospiraceae bacterium]|nr:hypothetical protein [Saprospiraceae bacterium]HNT19316.1 hypothetical protein [Saprospiraceae bacterium]
MSSQDIELILSRQLSEYLAVPMALIDHDGKMVYYNEAAGFILGKHFDEDGEIDLRDWGGRFFNHEGFTESTDLHEIPFFKVLSVRHLVQGEYYMRNFEEINQKLMIVCVPLVGLSQRELGALIFINLVNRL